MTMEWILFGLWFFLPAGAANVTPILAAKLPVLSNLAYPIDCNKKVRGQRILGDHKTWRGLIVGLISGTIVAILQMILVYSFPQVFYFVPSEYFYANPIILGLLLSFGALFGDMVKSYFKRQIGIPEGKSWLGFDQIDYVLGGIIFSFMYLPFPGSFYFLIAIEWIGMHFLFSYLGYLLSLKATPI